jgi:hypothetical protein
VALAQIAAGTQQLDIGDTVRATSIDWLNVIRVISPLKTSLTVRAPELLADQHCLNLLGCVATAVALALCPTPSCDHPQLLASQSYKRSMS